MKVKIKIPINKIEKNDICEKVIEHLEKDKNNAYTVQGLMMEVFGVNKKDLEGTSFSDRNKNLNTMYGRITNCLRKLEKFGKVKSAKHERAFVYWINPEYSKLNIKLKKDF
jgi:hypothetical protein